MVVFTKHGLKERINLCLFFQSLADILFMTANFLIYSDRIYLEIFGMSRRGPVFRFFVNNYLVGLYGFGWTSGFMTAVIACERCFCVISPLRSQTVLKTKSMLIIILVSFFFILCGFFVVGSRWSITCIFDPRTNSSFSELYPSKFFLLHKKLVKTLDGYVYGIMLPGTTMSVVSISTIITVVILNKLALWREQSSTAATTVRDVALTRMLVGCSVLFVVTTVPGVAFPGLHSVRPGRQPARSLLQHFQLHGQCHGAVSLRQLLLQLLHLLHYGQKVQNHSPQAVLQKGQGEAKSCSPRKIIVSWTASGSE